MKGPFARQSGSSLISKAAIRSTIEIRGSQRRQLVAPAGEGLSVTILSQRDRTGAATRYSAATPN